MVKEIAWQARCAVYIRNDTVYIQYLSEEPGSVIDIIDETNTLLNSLTLELPTDTDIVTSMEGTWILEGTQEKSYEVNKKKNVDRYGTRKVEHDFFLYSEKHLVEKTMDFWLNRSSYIWRHLRIDLPIYTALQFDVGDYISIAYSAIDPLAVSPATTLAQVQGMTYDSMTHKITLDLWTAVAYSFGDLSSGGAFLDDTLDALLDDPIGNRGLIDYTPEVFRETSTHELTREVRTEPKPAFSYVYFGRVQSYTSGNVVKVDLYDKDGNLYTSGEYYDIDVTVLSTGGTTIPYCVPYLKAGVDIQVIQYPGDNKF